MIITFADKKLQNQYFPQSRPHPGETLAEKLEEMGMGSKEFAISVQANRRKPLALF